MLTVIRYLVKEKLIVSLLLFLIFLCGVMSLKSLNRESIPQVNFDMVSIKTIYPGGSPDEMENLISIPVEKKLIEVDGIDKVRSYNIENVSVMAVYLDEDASDKPQIVQDIKDAVDLVEDLPDNAEDPVVEEIKVDKTDIFYAAITAKDDSVPFTVLRKTAQAFEKYMYDFKGVAEVEKNGYYDREFLVEVNPDALQRYRIGINDVVNTIRLRNIDQPGGSLKVGSDEYVLRTKGQYNNIKEILDTVIQSNDSGYAVRVRDVATASNTVEEPDILERYDGQKAMVFNVKKKRSADEITLTEKITADLKNFKNPFPDQTEIKLFNIAADFTKDTIGTVIDNAITGFILLALILFLMLGTRMASLVTATIPFVFMVAFIGLNMAGVTINVISLFGMIMVLGMIVDFGIVISENTFRYMESGLTKKEAIIKGTSELIWPVTTTFLCICTTFMPIMILTGIMGKFLKFIPMVVLICLAASWTMAIFFMPTILNIFLPERMGGSSPEQGRLKTFISTYKGKIRRLLHLKKKDTESSENSRFQKFQAAYKRLLTGALRHRYAVILVLFIMLVLSVPMIGVVGFVFMPDGGEKQININTYMPNSRNLYANLEQVKKIEKIAKSCIRDDEYEGIYSRVGTEVPFGLDPKPGDGTHKTTMYLFLTDEKDRERKVAEIEKEVREKIFAAQDSGVLAKDMRIVIETNSNGPPVGDPVTVEIRGTDFEEMNRIADEYTAFLKDIPGVYDIKNDFEEGKTEFRYRADEVMASRAMVSTTDIATTINASFEGAVATTVHEGEDEIDIRVRFKDSERKKLNDLNSVMISNNQNGLIPLSNVTTRQILPGYSQINRMNYRRLIQVKANIDTEVNTSVNVNTLLSRHFRDVEDRYPGNIVTYGGEQEETSKSMGQMGRYFIVAMVVMFIILAIFFKSLILPFVVMIAIPFSLIGVILALLCHGEPLCFVSFLALFALAGIIVSNTVTLVDFINSRRRETADLSEALAEATSLRLRPIILTTGTTVLGLVPSIYALTGNKDYMTAPLALAFGYGLLFATVITLILVPCFYHTAEDLKMKAAKILSKANIHIDPRIYRESLAEEASNTEDSQDVQTETAGTPPEQNKKLSAEKTKKRNKNDKF